MKKTLLILLALLVAMTFVACEASLKAPIAVTLGTGECTLKADSQLKADLKVAKTSALIKALKTESAKFEATPAFKAWVVDGDAAAASATEYKGGEEVKKGFKLIEGVALSLKATKTV